MLGSIIPLVLFGSFPAVLLALLAAERAKRQRTQFERDNALEALSECEAKYAAILNALPDMMFVLDADGTCLEWYVKEPRNLYVPPDRFIGRNIRDILPPELAEVFAETFKNVLSSGEPASAEYSLSIADLTADRMNILTECHNFCEQSLREVRPLSYALHPPALDRLGLVPSLEWSTDGLRKRSGMIIRLQAAHEVARLPLELETDIFRIVQEGLSNIGRHSGSRTATVSLGQRAGTAGSGNGAGFGVAPSRIRERLRRWGGHLHIRSGSDGGGLLVHVPVPKRGHHYESNAGSKQVQGDQHSAGRRP